jgi:hypothetical protein
MESRAGSGLTSKRRRERVGSRGARRPRPVPTPSLPRSEIISHAVRLYYRFNLSHRDVEELLAERGIQVSYEAIRLLVPQVRSGLR